MIFTFGFGHECSCGLSLRACYVDMPSREAMVATYGIKWAFQYDTTEGAGVDKWGLREVAPGEGCECGMRGRMPWTPETAYNPELVARLLGFA